MTQLLHAHPRQPVRGIMLPLGDSDAARALSAAVRQHLRPLAAEDALWVTDAQKYHATLFHASTHQVARQQFSASKATQICYRLL